jgi:hypothetical protein
MRVAPAHHPHRRFHMDDCGLRLQPHGTDGASPKGARGAQLGDGQELVGIGGEEKSDASGGIFEIMTLRLQPAQILHRGGKARGQFLRLGGTGAMIDAGIDHQRRAAVAALGDRRHVARHTCPSAGSSAARPVNARAASGSRPKLMSQRARSRLRAS